MELDLKENFINVGVMLVEMKKVLEMFGTELQIQNYIHDIWLMRILYMNKNALHVHIYLFVTVDVPLWN